MSNFYSPLRYPGGKGRLAKYFADIVEVNGLVGGHYFEPYAGGAGVALSLLLNEVVSHIYLNDLNYPLFCFWDSVLNNTEDLCKKIHNVKLTVNSWERHRHRVINSSEYNNLDVGFSMLFLNRTNRSGMIRGGMIGGYEQAGKWKIDARFYKKTLIKRIEQRERVYRYIIWTQYSLLIL